MLQRRWPRPAGATQLVALPPLIDTDRAPMDLSGPLPGEGIADGQKHAVEGPNNPHAQTAVPKEAVRNE